MIVQGILGYFCCRQCKVHLDTLNNNFVQNIICSEPSDLIIFKIVCYLGISREILNRDRGSGGLWQISWLCMRLPLDSSEVSACCYLWYGSVDQEKQKLLFLVKEIREELSSDTIRMANRFTTSL